MQDDLAAHIGAIRVVDTHSHMQSDLQWAENAPGDLLYDLFRHYGKDDLVSAGASREAVVRLLDAADPDIAGRFAGVAAAWRAMRFTGYGEAVRVAAREIYAIEELSGPALAAAQETHAALRTAPAALHLMRDRAHLDHIQIDSGLQTLDNTPNAADFYLRDLSWVSFCTGDVTEARREMLAAITGVTITDLASLLRTMETLFALRGPRSIAVKSQHAYQRTLAWRERGDADAERALGRILAGEPGTEQAEHPDRLGLGDWCLAHGARLAGEYDLPFKIHTGYLAGSGVAAHGGPVGSFSGSMTGDMLPLDRLRAAHLTPLLSRYPQTRFVLMHLAYPYDGEILAIAKHFPNAYLDLCWAWSIDPATSAAFVRRALHTAPVNKLFGFGDDTGTPVMAYAYAAQMRRWLAHALRAEVADDLLTPGDAQEIATRLLRENQLACFRTAETRAAIHAGMGATAGDPWPYRYRPASP